MNLRISDYYMQAQIFEPSYFDKREFGFVINGEWARYKQFDNLQKLRAFLIENAPEHVYFSIAKYEMPWAEKKDKGWLGSDIVFDLDKDKLKPCQL